MSNMTQYIPHIFSYTLIAVLYVFMLFLPKSNKFMLGYTKFYLKTTEIKNMAEKEAMKLKEQNDNDKKS